MSRHLIGHWSSEPIRTKLPQRHWLNLTLPPDRRARSEFVVFSATRRAVAGLLGRYQREDDAAVKIAMSGSTTAALKAFAEAPSPDTAGVEDAEAGNAKSETSQIVASLLTGPGDDPFDGIDGAEILDRVGRRSTLPPLPEGNSVSTPDGQSVPETSGLHDGAVVMAVIDDGIPVAHARFLTAEGKTRVLALLDMDGKALPPGSANPDIGDRVQGRTWTAATINRLMDEMGGDETAVYRAMGFSPRNPNNRDPLTLRSSHGGFVLDLAAGFDFNEAEEAEKRPILAVQLPRDLIDDLSGTQMANVLPEALRWIEARIDAEVASRGRYPPLVVTLAFGIHAGLFDGNGPVAAALAAFRKAYRCRTGQPCEIVVAAGNSFQARGVAEVPLPNSDSHIALEWRLQPDDRTSSFVQLWREIGATGQAGLAMALQPPAGRGPDPVWSEPDKLTRLNNPDGEPLAGIYHQILTLNNQRYEQITAAIAPTEPEDATAPAATAPAGKWTLLLRNDAAPQDETVRLRIQRDDPVPWIRRSGRQSWFDAPAFERFDPDTGRPVNRVARDRTPVVRSASLNLYGVSNAVVTVGGFRDTDGEPAFYSAAGPSDADPSGAVARAGPDLCVVTEEGGALRGVLAAGGLSGGSLRRISGTSAAAPQAARLIADLIASGVTDPVAALKNQANASEAAKRGRHRAYDSRISPTGVPDLARIGNGRLRRDPPPAHRRRFEAE